MRTTKKRRVSIKLTSLDKVNEVLSNFDNGKVELYLYVEDTPKSYKTLSRNQYIEDWEFVDEEEKPEEEEEKDDPKPEPEPVKEKVTAVPSRVVKKVEVNEVTEDLLEQIKDEYTRAEEKEAEEVVAEEESIPEEESGELKLPDIKIKDMMDLARVVEASWRLARKSPSIRFNSSLFRTQIKNEYDKLLELENNENSASFSDKTTRAVSRLLLGVYYSNPRSVEGLNAAFSDTMGKIRDNYDSLKSVDTLNKVMNILYRHEED